MRKAVIASAIAALLFVPGIALADGPSGSSEDPATNEVTCNHTAGPTAGGVNVGAAPAGNWVYVGPGGVETCSDDGIPLDGRVIVSSAGYITTDGDQSNPDPLFGCIHVPGGEGSSASGCGPDRDGTE